MSLRCRARHDRISRRRQRPGAICYSKRLRPVAAIARSRLVERTSSRHRAHAMQHGTFCKRGRYLLTPEERSQFFLLPTVERQRPADEVAYKHAIRHGTPGGTRSPARQTVPYQVSSCFAALNDTQEPE